MDDGERDREGTAPTLAAADTATRAEPVHDAPPIDRGDAVARYRIDTVLGRGGMGEVVSARDDQIGRSVAIKRMRTAAPSDEALARFLREARIQGRLDHPAVVPVHELARDEDGRPFFVMKQLAGTTLEQVLAGGDEKFTRQRLLRAFVDVCLAIEFAHTRGVVHRDLKPANITLGDFGEVYVLDWGIARVVGETERASFTDIESLEGTATMAGMVLGTPGYMAPEQLRGDADLDGGADVYALGCILFEILAGAPYHPRGQAALASTLIPPDAKPSARAPDRDVAPELDAACVAALHLARADRLATARELGELVQRYLDGDRDLALRNELARGELATARAALERGDSTEARRTAIRAAARALALDPRLREAAELVGRLMLQAPDEAPPEVEEELAAHDRAALARQASLGGRAMLGYIAFFPFMYAAGLRDAWYYAVIGGAIAIAVLIARAVVRKPRSEISYVAYALNLVVIAVFARVASPVLVAPGLAVVTIIMFANDPRSGRIVVLAGTAVAAILAPWLVEMLGALPQTVDVAGNHVVLTFAGDALDPVLIRVAFALYIVVMVTVAGGMSRMMTNTRRDMQRKLQIQAWQLRQLLPRAATDT